TGLTVTGDINVDSTGTSTFSGGLTAVGITSTGGLHVDSGDVLFDQKISVGSGTSTFSGDIFATNIGVTGLNVTGDINLPNDSIQDAEVSDALTISSSGSIDSSALNSGTLGNAGVTLALGSFGSITGSLGDANVADNLTIDGGIIGAVTPAAGTFTTLTYNTLFRGAGDSEIAGDVNIFGQQINIGDGKAGTTTLTGAGGLGIGTSTPGAGLALGSGTTTILGLDVYAWGQLNVPFINATTTDTNFFGGSLSVTESATSTFVGGVDVTTTGGLSSASGITLSGGELILANIIGCTEALETTDDGTVICGTDETGAAGSVSDLQDAYNLQSADAQITTTNNKNLVFFSSDTATDSNIQIVGNRHHHSRLRSLYLRHFHQLIGIDG
ncbi:MAG: hypothetical protein HYS44_00310, partial [Candidatus Niyogibacteria bacterium]|nr:hypothetical protein [Candidatus Niyogibacteria bacterium]